MADAWGEPVKVSALIRSFRWMLLISGIAYGITKHAAFSKLEDSLRKRRLEEKKLRKAKLDEERRIASEKDIAFFVALAEPDPNKVKDDDDD